MVTRAEAVELFESTDLMEIGMRADEVRRRLHPGGVASYAIDRIIKCPQAEEAVFAEIRETIELGGTAIRLEGKVSTELLRKIKTHFEIHCQALDIADANTIARLQEVGLDSIAGGSAEVHRAAHALGMRTTATVLLGGEETMNRLELVRQIQEETGGFTAFIPFVTADTTAVEYLKVLAISRIYLENIPNIESSWTALGLKTCQVGLRFGSNDVGSAAKGASEEDLRRLIRDAGLVPKQRDTLYSQYFLN